MKLITKEEINDYEVEIGPGDTVPLSTLVHKMQERIRATAFEVDLWRK